MLRLRTIVEKQIFYNLYRVDVEIERDELHLCDRKLEEIQGNTLVGKRNKEPRSVSTAVCEHVP